MDKMGAEGAVGRLRHSYLLSPITALSFYHDATGRVFVLAAEDTWLKIFDVATNQLLSQLNIFHSQPIHGIYSSEVEGTPGEEAARVLLWGGQSIAVLSQAAVQSLIERRTPSPPTELRAADWIYDGILFSSEHASGALVTAHNEIIPLSTDTNGQTSFGPLTSPSRPILYSANLRLLSPDCILVAGGTVFGEIIVWKYHLDATRPSSQWDLLFVFTGHEGSIFGVSVSPELEIAAGVKARLLASCSDDRTIRVWDITDRRAAVDGDAAELQPGTLGDARETGFGANSEVRAAHEADSARCVAVVMGHVSRIWHVKFSGRADYASPGAGNVEVFSFGEDGSRQRWELAVGLSTNSAEVEGPSSVQGALVGSLTNCGTSTAHSGKNIWAAAVTVGDTWPLVVSGGADGKVAMSGDVRVRGGLDGHQGIEGQLSDGESSSVLDIDTSFSLEEVTELIHGKPESDLATLPKKPVKKAAKDGFLRYAFISETAVLATSVSGRLFLGTAKESITWEEIATTEATRADLSSYNVVKSPTRDTAVLGGASGKMYIYRRSHGLTDLAHFPGKITDIICLGGAQGVHQPPDAKIPETFAALVTVLGVNHAVMLKYNVSTGESWKDPRTIKFDDDYQNYAMTAASLCESKLVVGSRVGLLTLYESSASSFTPLVSRKDSPSKDSITCILLLPHSTTSFLTTSRDGRYRIYTILPTAPTPTLHLQHEISPPLAILEGAWFTPTSDLILYGFRGKSFLVWNETTRSPLAILECGGAHRPFAYISSPTGPGALRLVFTTKGAHLRFFAQPRPPLRALQPGGHGREIRAVAACGAYVATAAEDTTVRVWESCGGDGFRCLAVLERHTAGIQSLAWCGEGCLVSTAGNEEMFVWRVARLETGTLGVVCEAVYPDRSEGGDLRIVGLDVGAGWDGGIVVSVGLSDSTVRTYLYGGEGGGFKLLAKGRYTGACLTQVRHLRVEEGVMWLVTAATDGFVGVWVARKGEGGFELVMVERLHQSSVKSLDIAASGAEGGWLVITGGDDNALGFLDLVWSGEGFTVASKSRVKSAHAAAVTGLRAVRAGGGVTEVATVSNDQRLKVWRVKRKVGAGISVAMLENRYSSVADPGDVEIIAPGRLMVGGVGMEVWEV
ncbi:WD40-repeat-containing domain protein [Schizothecium vesticola]|uniref:WD40-repeat-containing domain protein n=1 Tax=Schizothecium vesticola TaxID=314040 RepID=A0AA40K521_9PEZI|nr:WD40-repeat-containing domain protein [Schizothecium vesticola]